MNTTLCHLFCMFELCCFMNLISSVKKDDDDDDDVYVEYYSGKGFHINYSVYMSYVKHINPANKALVRNDHKFV
jgi:hypothetical protein